MGRRKKTNFMPSEEALKQQQQELLVEMNKLDNKMRKSRKNKFIIIFSIIIIIIAIIKIFFGTIELYNIFGTSKSNARYYKVTVNNKHVAVSYTATHTIPIIPFLVNFNSVYLGNSNIVGDDTVAFYSDDSDKYIIDVNSYSCYYENIKTECTNNEQNMKKDNDTKYTKVKITRITNPHEVVYEGKYINNITPYITKKGQYHIEITARYELTKSEIYFYFYNK